MRTDGRKDVTKQLMCSLHEGVISASAAK